MRRSTTLYVSVLLFNGCSSRAYVPPAIQRRWKEEKYTVDQAIQTIEECAEAGASPEDNELYYAVRFIDRNAHHVYRDMKAKEDLGGLARGSWELRLAYEDPKSRYFFPFPDFRAFAMAFVMVEENYFGKGIAPNPGFCYVAMGGPSAYNAKTRQLYMNYKDFYISGRAVPDWDLSYFMRGYARNWYDERRTRPPLAFTLIAASEKVLVVRGSKTGGMAIFRRLQQDMQPAAYGT